MEEYTSKWPCPKCGRNPRGYTPTSIYWWGTIVDGKPMNVCVTCAVQSWAAYARRNCPQADPKREKLEAIANEKIVSRQAKKINQQHIDNIMRGEMRRFISARDCR